MLTFTLVTKLEIRPVPNATNKSAPAVKHDCSALQSTLNASHFPQNSMFPFLVSFPGVVVPPTEQETKHRARTLFLMAAAAADPSCQNLFTLPQDDLRGTGNDIEYCM